MTKITNGQMGDTNMLEAVRQSLKTLSGSELLVVNYLLAREICQRQGWVEDKPVEVREVK